MDNTKSFPFTVHRADWPKDGAALAAVRRAVFVMEQCVPEEEEWDDDDARGRHVVACTADGSAIGTGRLIPQPDHAHIGRMAVLKAWRGRGVGDALLRELIAIARETGYTETHLHAQTHALAFYRKQGYIAVGEEFIEAGIPHVEMRLTLKP